MESHLLVAIFWGLGFGASPVGHHRVDPISAGGSHHVRPHSWLGATSGLGMDGNAATQGTSPSLPSSQRAADAKEVDDSARRTKEKEFNFCTHIRPRI